MFVRRRLSRDLVHLGFLRVLHDTKLLQCVTRICSVSGGSILAAHAVLNWPRYLGSDTEFESIANDIIALARADVRGRIVRRWVLTWLMILPRLLRRRRWIFTAMLER